MTRNELVRNLDLLRRIVQRWGIKLDSIDFGLCPFHEEKSPSFHIRIANSGRARFHCFGCGADGDIFDFIMRTERLTFSAALHRLKGMLTIEDEAKGVASGSPQGSRGPPLSDSLPSDQFCEQDCTRYTNLLEDYQILLEENKRLRECLKLPLFQPGATYGPYKYDDDKDEEFN